MTAEAVAGLFGQLRHPDRGLQWLADELIAAATERSVLVIEAFPTPGYERVLYLLSHPPVWIERFRVSVFRTLLALFSGIGRRETGADVNPYGDRFQIARQTATGPAEVWVDFINTPGMQRLQIIAEPAAHPAGTNGTAAG